MTNPRPNPTNDLDELHAQFEPPNEEKDRRNQTGETAVGDPSLDEGEPPEDPNVAIAETNKTPSGMPEGDAPQTPAPEYWREPPYVRAEIEVTDPNDVIAKRNQTPEIVIGAPSADIITADLRHEPVVEFVPEISQDGGTLSCTMGIWYGAPDSRTYQWQSDGADVADATAETYTVKPEDVGHTFTCVQTATNGYGTSAPATSNAIVVVDPQQRSASRARR